MWTAACFLEGAVVADEQCMGQMSLPSKTLKCEVVQENSKYGLEIVDSFAQHIENQLKTAILWLCL